MAQWAGMAISSFFSSFLVEHGEVQRNMKGCGGYHCVIHAIDEIAMTKLSDLARSRCASNLERPYFGEGYAVMEGAFNCLNTLM